jgi:hypothetical protein
MTEATANLAQAGSDSAAPSTSLDDLENLSYFDPDEDNEEAEKAQESTDETVETDDETTGQETDEAADADETATEAEGEGEADASNPEPKDDVTVSLNGEQLPLKELKSGYMRQADYSRKTQEVATKRRDLEALSARVTGSVNAIAEFLVKQLPEAPDLALAATNPGEYVQKKALHDASMAQINAILSKVGEVKEVGNKLTTEQRSELLQAENVKLAEAFPATANPDGRKKFFDAAAGAARELGYTDAEIAQVLDHRMFALAHYARLGMQAEKAKAKAAKKVENVPPVAPQKRQPGLNAAKTQRNKEAVKRLARSGSLEDALAVDWE